MTRARAAVLTVLLLFPIEPARAQQAMIPSPVPGISSTTRLIPPVDGAIVESFRAPETVWGPGHRGIDYSVPEGTSVRAAAAGTVTFAGSVAGTLAVTIEHPDGLETTYSQLATIEVTTGERVTQGAWLGTIGLPHGDAAPGLHFGARSGGAYVDPATLLYPIEVAGAFSLVPLLSAEAEELVRDRSGVRPELLPLDCSDAGRVQRAEHPPNDNVAVAIAGIGSHTEGGIAAAIYERGPELLGYPEPLIYRFSYRGIDGSDLHEPYAGSDTYGDIREAAGRLRDLLAAIARRHPGRDVDLIAHSQGGIVARAYLQMVAETSDTTLPRVAHLVTFSSPHEGAPLARAGREIADDTLGGALVLDATASLTGLPPTDAPAVGQLAPGSKLLGALASESLPFGTRALSLAIPNDIVVPADRALYEHGATTVVSPKGSNGHSAVVSSTEARGLAYSFLAGGASPCPDGWDRWGPRLGWLASQAEGLLPELAAALETAVLGRFGALLGALPERDGKGPLRRGGWADRGGGPVVFFVVETHY